MTEIETNTERWRRLDEIFNAAVELPPEERQAFVARAAAGDESLRRAVDRLMAADKAAESFLQEPLETPAAFAAAELAASEAGRLIGPYRLLRKLGQGGMGAVYLAEREDDQFDRQVAIKLIRHGFESREIRRRFRAERQALASLEHPNIARMYDGGTLDDGRPFLVMEYVEGRPIDEYCDRHRLPVSDRLKLFREVCAAVQHAHNRLLIHRDIKPTNVLVTEDGVPKLLDFGLSKALVPIAGQSIHQTRTGFRLMTPGYASPEQARGEAITTATDVYSLGVLLYELLAGHRPFQLSGDDLPSAIERVICEQVPERPSVAAGRRAATGDGGIDPETVARARRVTPRQLRYRLEGDLDNIVLMALRKEPERRYTLVEQLSSDIRRHLEQHPVLARPDTLLYRGGKFLRRHRLAVTAAAMIVVLTVAFVIALAGQAKRAAEERDRSDQVAQFLLEIFAVSAPDEAVGDTITARQILDAGAQRIGIELSDRPRLQATMLDTMGVAYQQLGLHGEARALIEQGLDIRRRLFGEEHPDVATSLHNLAVVNTEDGRQDLAQSQYRQALDMRRRLLGGKDPKVAATLEGMAINLWWDGKLAEVRPLLEEALAIRRAAYGREHREVAMTLSNLGVLLQRTGDHRAAEPLVREALEIRRRIFGEVHPEVAASHNDLATLYLELGDAAAAVPIFQEALRVQREFLGDDHPEVANTRNNLAQCYESLGRYEEAEETFRALLETRLEKHEGPHPGLATTKNNLANVLHLKGELESAETLFREALAMRLELFGESHPYVFQTLNSLGRVLHDRGDASGAEACLRQAAEGIAANVPEGHPAHAYPGIEMARVLLAKGDPTGAEGLLLKSLALLRDSLPADHWRIAWVESLLGESLTAQGRFEEAEPLLLASYPVLRARRSDRDPRTRRAIESVVELYRVWDKPVKIREFAELL